MLKTINLCVNLGHFVRYDEIWCILLVKKACGSVGMKREEINLQKTNSDQGTSQLSSHQHWVRLLC